MIILRRAETRHSERFAGGEIWHSFDAQDPSDVYARGFGALIVLDEELLAPFATARVREPSGGEILLYVREGSLTYVHPSGDLGVMRAGEFQRPKRDHSEDKNASCKRWARVFWMGLRPTDSALELDHEQVRLSTAERRGRLCVVASPDARGGSLRVTQDVMVYSALLDPGQHVVHEIKGGRSVWLHLVQGEATVGGGVLMTTADSVAVSGERSVSFTARTTVEVLLFDLRRRVARLDHIL